MSDLWYRAGSLPKDLAIGECTIFLARIDVWMLAFCFRRKTDGKIERRTLGVNPNGDFDPKRLTWGLHRVEAGRWQVSPSIQCIDRVPDESRREGYRDDETWHETPTICGVPESEPWCAFNAYACGCEESIRAGEGKRVEPHIEAQRTTLQVREQAVVDAAVAWVGARKYATQADVAETEEALYQAVQRLEGAPGFSSLARMLRRTVDEASSTA